MTELNKHGRIKRKHLQTYIRVDKHRKLQKLAQQENTTISQITREIIENNI